MSEFIHIDATPQKRIFLSIIADYSINTSICELIDNAIDHWIDNNKENTLNIDLRINVDRQTIVISDDAGGVKREDLQLLVAPGASRETLQEGLIGNFGVGGKRAGIALGELVEIKTRYKKSKTYEFELSDKWLGQNDWTVDVYECENISPGTTTVRISKMRQGFDSKAAESLKKHIAETYGKLISEKCRIAFNGECIEPITFDKWAFPPEYSPSQHTGKVGPFGLDGAELKVRITGGLTFDRDPTDRN